ncbi:MAG: Rpn family recombination-promoting nuclease/putative transposase, partial [Azospirillaceae bacterium]|nr:Rpn family recombination-promoting nuclease/putative transposase [Azospirillaceae bacterium]
MPSDRDDYDSPWKDVLEHHFLAFIAFYFPAAAVAINWSCGYDFLDSELQKVVQDAELGRRVADKLVRVTLRGGDEAWIYIHIEIQGRREATFAERMFVYNYRLYDRYRKPVASLAVLADDDAGWRPSSFGFDVMGCQHVLTFPTVKLLDWGGREDDLLLQDDPFALITAAHLLTRATRHDMPSRYVAKWKVVRLLYEHGWDRQRVIDLFAVIDWMMRLPGDLDQQLWQNIRAFEARGTMRYVTSVERFCIEEGLQQG